MKSNLFIHSIKRSPQSGRPDKHTMTLELPSSNSSSGRLILVLLLSLLSRSPASAFQSLHQPQVSSTKTLLWANKPKKLGPRRIRSSSGSPVKHAPGGERPVLTDYAQNRNEETNRQRLRSQIGCEHFGECPGCVVNEKVGSVDIVQSAKLYFSSTAIRKKRADVVNNGQDWAVEEKDDGFYRVVVPSSVKEWRTQAKLAVSPKSSSWARDGCSFGLYQKGTHKVLSIPDCAVHHPSINRAVNALVQATNTVGTPAFHEDTREGGLRYVQLQVERTTGRVCLTLIWNAATLKETQPALSRVVKELNRQEPDLWHSVWCHCNDGVGNNIFSRNLKRWHRIAGPEFVREPLPIGNRGWLYFSPLAFRQGNIDGFDILANDVAKTVPGGSKVCELYGGVGVLGLTALAYHAQEGQYPLSWLRVSDENPNNPRCFSRAVASLPAEVTGRRGRYNRREEDEDQGMTISELAAQMQSGAPAPKSERSSGDKTSYLIASAAKALQSGQALGAQVLIVDPPRRGLEDEVLEELCKPFNPDQPYAESTTLLARGDDKVNWTNDVQTMVYVSCGFDALARDCERLLNSGAGWLLESATGYILFPGSNHVETLCVFKRS